MFSQKTELPSPISRDLEIAVSSQTPYLHPSSWLSLSGDAFSDVWRQLLPFSPHSHCPSGSFILLLASPTVSLHLSPSNLTPFSQPHTSAIGIFSRGGPYTSPPRFNMPGVADYYTHSHFSPQCMRPATPPL